MLNFAPFLKNVKTSYSVGVSNGWHDVVQGSPEWDELREGRFTSSQIHRLKVEQKLYDKKGNYLPEKLLTEGGKTYAIETLQLNRKKTPLTEAMQNGTDREPEARFRFECTHNVKVQTTGFYTYEDWLGFSSDGLTTERNGRKGVSEIKCPEEKKHLKYCSCRNWSDIMKVDRTGLLGWEMCLPLLLLPELEVAWFVSYYPEYLATDRKHLALFALCLERNEELLTKLACSLLRAKICRDGLVKKLGL